MASSKDRKKVRIEIEFWLDDDGSIRVTSDAGPDFRIKVRVEPLKRNGHPEFYRRLAWLLKSADATAPDQ